MALIDMNVSEMDYFQLRALDGHRFKRLGETAVIDKQGNIVRFTMDSEQNTLNHLSGQSKLRVLTESDPETDKVYFVCALIDKYQQTLVIRAGEV